MKRLWIAALALLALCGAALAQAPVKPCVDTTNATLGTHDCFAVSSTNPLPVAAGGAAGAAGYPIGSVPVTGVFSGADTATATATLASAAGKFTYIAGFSVSGLGSTAGGPVVATVATVAGGNTLSYTYVYAASAATPNTPVSFTFSPPVPANAINTAITVTVPGQAGNTATQINAWGYQQ